MFSWLQGERGLRQDDPMLSLLFILYLKYFSRLIKLRTSELNFNNHPKCKQIKINILTFTDDLCLKEIICL